MHKTKEWKEGNTTMMWKGTIFFFPRNSHGRRANNTTTRRGAYKGDSLDTTSFQLSPFFFWHFRFRRTLGIKSCNYDTELPNSALKQHPKKAHGQVSERLDNNGSAEKQDARRQQWETHTASLCYLLVSCFFRATIVILICRTNKLALQLCEH